MNRNPSRGFALVDGVVLLAVVVVVAALLLATIAHATDLHRGVSSADNLRTLGAAHASYAADWSDRQLTFVDDFITEYGDAPGPAFAAFWEENGFPHPPLGLGWGRVSRSADVYGWLAYRNRGNCANNALHLPVEFTGEGCNTSLAYLGAFRLHNAEQMHAYLDGRFYDDVFYAPEDDVVIDAIEVGCASEGVGSYCRFADVDDPVGDIVAWSSYCMSPAAMFNPLVMAHDDPDDERFNGFVDPWSLGDGYRSPSLAQALYPDLKSNILEHHWLRNNPGETCNPAFDPGTYGDPGCEPYFFNHAAASSPITLFYDGRVAEILVEDAVNDDATIRDQNNANWGLWSQDTPWGADGYYSEFSFDGTQTSFHVLTTDGIRGRDVLGGGAPSRQHSTALPRPRPHARPATIPRRFVDTLPAAKTVISGD